MRTPLVPGDLLRFVLPSDPQAIENGAIYVRATFDGDTDEIRSSIWRATGDGDRALTHGPYDRLPRVAPDGRTLAYVTGKDDATLALLPLDGGAPRPLGDTLRRITALAWSPDGTRLAVVTPADHHPTSAAVYHDERSGARHIRRLPFKSDADGLLDGRRGSVVLVDVASGSARTITPPDLDVSALAWSPDGMRVAFTARDPQTPETATALADLYVVDADGGTPRRLSHGDGPMTLPAWSPDGAHIAVLGHRRGDDVGGRFDLELLVVALASGDIRSLCGGLGRTVGNPVGGDLRSGGNAAPQWRGNGEVVAQVGVDGCVELRVFTLDGAVRTVAGGERQIYGFSVREATLAIAYSDMVTPGEIALVDAHAQRLLTACNGWLAEREVIVPERYRPQAADGTVLDAWLMRPPHAADAAPPLVLEVHGGPHAAYGYTFFLEFQVLAGAGIAVAYGNPRGSQTYGEAYADAITGDWGGLDVSDVETILDGALALGRFDTARLGVAGGSYGGLMTTWLAGHSDRFKAAVSMRAVNDYVSEVGASDLGWFLEREIGTAWSDDAARGLFERSPIRAAAAIDCAFLVEHSERDYRCPIDQGEQLFTILRRMGKNDVEFVRFTDKGHEMSRGGKPRSRILRLRAIAHWFLRYLTPNGAASRDAGSLFAPLPSEDYAL